MLLAGRKYGFLTTYKETIFIRIDEQKDGYVINYSRSVNYDHEITRRSSVSVRQYMLFLVSQGMNKNDYDIHFDKGKLRDFIAISREECIKKTTKVPDGNSRAARSLGSLPDRTVRQGRLENQATRGSRERGRGDHHEPDDRRRLGNTTSRRAQDRAKDYRERSKEGKSRRHGR